MIPAPVKYILFDAVGTLLYAEPPVAAVYAAAGRRFGSRLTARDVSARFTAALHQTEISDDVAYCTDEQRERERWRQVVANVFDDLPASSDTLFQLLWDHFASADNWQLFDDVSETWQTLTQRGYTLGIASNFDARLLGICDHKPPLAAAARVFCSSQVGYAKPAPNFFARITTLLNASPAEILFIGDDPARDVSAGQAAGWRTLLIDRASPPQEGVLHDLRQLLKV